MHLWTPKQKYMAERTGKERIVGLQQQWKAQSLAYCGLLSLSAGLPVTVLLHRWLQAPLWVGGVVWLLLFGIFLFLFPYWRITVMDTTRYLNSVLPELEESCGLLLKPVEELGPLEKWQAEKTERRLAPLRVPRPLRRKLGRAAGLLGAACILCAGMEIGGAGTREHAVPTLTERVIPAPEKAIPGIRSVHLRILPPAYTGKTVREQHTFALQAEEGSVLSWQLETTMPVRSLQFIFNDTLQVSLHAEDTAHTLWRWSTRIGRPGFYQVKVEDQLSDLYKIEVIPDEPPHILIRTPKPYTVVDFGESRRIPLLARLQDDYGISDAQIVATIASGSGEAVKFKEQTLRFDRTFTGDRTSYDLEKTIDLTALGLRPGDELYFYLRVKDNHEQESRSDMYIISLPDTAQLMSLEGMTTGVDVKPEYFRSERQIILETEQLLRENDTISSETFKTRSNELGIDQKLLRLRYGKFLGEEAEEGSPGSHGEDVGGPADFGDAKKILDVYTDKHDNAEDAGFFEPAIKQQLKATLTEMWGAELRLRVFKPKEALPFAYKALRLLKDLQQKSRAYVAKTGVKVTPLDPAKRLAGELKDIGQPVQRQSKAYEPSAEDMLRVSLGLLEGSSFKLQAASDKPGRRDGGKGTGSGGEARMDAKGGGGGMRTDAKGRVAGGVISRVSLAVLQQAERQIGKAAAAHPGEYLDAYQAMRRIVEGRITGTDIASARRAIIKMLPEAAATPAAGKAPADAGLSQLYFRTLKSPTGKE